MTNATKRTFWNRPRLIKMQRPASLLELFFDIVVVALIGGIGHKLVSQFEHHNANWYSISFVVLQTLSVLIIWRAITMYSIKFEVLDLRHRLIIICTMLPMILMAAAGYADKGISDKIIVYLNTVSYAVLMFVVAYVFLSAAFSNKDDKYFFWYLMIKGIARTVVCILVIISILVPTIMDGMDSVDDKKWRMFFLATWLTEFLIQLGADLFSASKKYTTHFPHISRHLIKERYSILYIAFLGEIIIQIVSAFAQHLTTNTIIYLMAAIIQVLLMFWIYFDLLNFNDLRKSYNGITTYSFSMLLMFFSMLFIASGLSLLMISNSHEAIIMLSVGYLLYWITWLISYFSFKPYNKEARFIQPKWFNIVISLLWFVGLITTSSLAYVFQIPHILLWGVLAIQLITIGLIITSIIKSKEENLKLTEEEFEAKLPEMNHDWD